MNKTKKSIFFMLSILIAAIIFTSSFIGNVKDVFALDNIDIDAKAYCLYDVNTGTMIVEKDSSKHYEVASMVKLMTSLLTIEKIEKGEWTLENELTVSEYAASMEGSQAFLDAGKSYKIEDLLKSVIVASANDSSVVLAENFAGTENNFVDIMNKKAKSLGMTETLYANSTGLPSATEQHSTARDISILLKEVSKHNLYKKYCSIWMDKIIHHDGRETELVNTNRLIKYYPGCVCGKTGFTDEAGYCLSVLVEKNGMQLISVVMGAKSSSDRFSCSANLLNYGFGNFKNTKLVSCDQDILTGIKMKGTKTEIVCKPENDLYILDQNGKECNYKTETEIYDLPKKLKKGSIIGKIKITKDDNVVNETNLICQDDYKTATYGDAIHNIFENWELKADL